MTGEYRGVTWHAGRRPDDSVEVRASFNTLTGVAKFTPGPGELVRQGDVREAAEALVDKLLELDRTLARNRA